MIRGTLGEVFSSKDGNKDVKSIIEEQSLKFALGSNSTIDLML